MAQLQRERDRGRGGREGEGERGGKKERQRKGEERRRKEIKGRERERERDRQTGRGMQASGQTDQIDRSNVCRTYKRVKAFAASKIKQAHGIRSLQVPEHLQALLFLLQVLHAMYETIGQNVAVLRNGGVAPHHA